jgi:hypothetical protein
VSRMQFFLGLAGLVAGFWIGLGLILWALVSL